MLTYKGKHGYAHVMIDVVDPETVKQIYSFLNHPAFAGTYIAIMPDCHAGAGAVIGFTARLNDYVIPNVVGVDIGCGIDAYCVGKVEMTDTDFRALDETVRNDIPSGFSVHDDLTAPQLAHYLPAGIPAGVFFGNLKDICKKIKMDYERACRSLGTLGGGNHFIEVDRDDRNQLWVMVHSGSRQFGLMVANYHQKKAKELLHTMFVGDAYKNLEYLPMDMGGRAYLDDMRFAQMYARVNRRIMLQTIVEDYFDVRYEEYLRVNSVHNYISFKDGIVRKGAISAQHGERVIIPLNMRDGVIFGHGKGNKKWNFSAPHGAGRVLSRKRAKAELTVEDFERDMEGIWTSCVGKSTLDESPRAYKDSQLIQDAIGETVEVEFMANPIYNFKANEEEK